ncbi:Mrpl9p [Saccharomyces cerevisiae FostersB]|nr:Mrpl9p [Saccharomyces cerevisiae FostersB]
MKRYGFKGLRASHGTSIMHRHGGSYGQNQDPGRVLPGRKMPGHMGNEHVTIQNVKVLKVDDENNVIWVKGSVAGPKNSFVKIQDAIKKNLSIKRISILLQSCTYINNNNKMGNHLRIFK